MQFNDASEIDQVCYFMRLADYPRGKNRAMISELFNGNPPFSATEVEQNGIAVNANFLEGTRITHDARSQFYSAFLKPGNYFKATTDMGPIHKRSDRSAIVTREMNRIMKRSMDYFECFRSRFALDVLHGIGPAAWRNRECWCPDPLGIEDVLVPANTYLTMKNLPFFATYWSFTAPELIKLTRGPNVDPGWNMDLVNSCIEWIDKETTALMGNNWAEVWSPEKAQERVKGDGGFYAGDQVPTIDVFDFYFWNDEGDTSGWNRRMILDAWSTPASTGVGYQMSRKIGDPWDRGKSSFLFNPGNRKYADKREELISFQFADLSAVAPFRYHSVRSLGWLLYSICNLQNRLRSKFSESVFEALMMYFRVKSEDDLQRGLKVNLFNRGFIDETFQFIPAAERFQVNSALVQLGLRENQQIISDHSSSFSPNLGAGNDGVEKTKFQVMAETNAMTSMVSAALLQAYQYQTFEYREIFRRFCIPNSSDPDVREFRARCLKRGVPDKMLVPEAWDLEPDRIMGAGNKTLEMAIAQQLMEYRNLYDPDSQRKILHDVTLAITDDPSRAEMLVPDEPHKVTDSVHDAQLAAGTLMTGLPVSVKTGINHVEYVETLLADMGILIQQIGAVGTPEKITGLQNMAKHIADHIQIIAQDPKEKARVKRYGDMLGKMMNLVKAMAQRMQQAQQANGNGGLDPKDAAKIAATNATAQAKIQNMRESHSQRTAQKRITFEQQIQLDQERHAVELRKEAREEAHNVLMNRLKGFGSPDEFYNQ